MQKQRNIRFNVLRQIAQSFLYVSVCAIFSLLSRERGHSTRLTTKLICVERRHKEKSRKNKTNENIFGGLFDNFTY